MSKFKNLAGQKFGRLEVKCIVGRDKHRNILWLCKCDCGNYNIVTANQLRKNRIRSCGCLWRDRMREVHTKHGHNRVGKKTKEYTAWYCVIQRCTNPRHKYYKNYGGRGIKVCDRWLDPEHGFENFLADMGPCPGPGYSIERRDNNGDYCPENCYWATRVEQANNTRRNIYVEFNGEIHTIAEWARITGIHYDTLKGRISRRNWPIEKALTTPVHIQNKEVTQYDEGKMQRL